MPEALQFYAFYAALGLIGVPGEWAYWSRKYSLNEERYDLACCVGSALLFGPISTILGFFHTGFYEYGFKFKFNDGYRHRRH